MMKINKAIGMSASFLVAGAMLVGGIAPASAAPMPRDVATVAVAAQAPATYEVKAGKKDGRPVVELTLSNGRAVQNNDGTVTLVDAAGKVITTYGKTITDPTTGQSGPTTPERVARGNRALGWGLPAQPNARYGAKIRQIRLHISFSGHRSP